jgi:N-dimethylarginine dimethylaminohydrolase
LGGPGWIPRTGSHAEEVAAGVPWQRCGYRSEWAPLSAVLLARPPACIADIAVPSRYLMVDRVDLAAMSVQANAIACAYRRHGIRVLFLAPPADCPPNVVFQRDLFFMTPEGAVLARTASAQRAGEERYAAEALAAGGFPILRTPTGTATFEGADALWVDRDTVAVGVGFRTNAAGVEMLRDVLRAQSVDVVPVPLGAGVQHLLGSMVPLDERLAVVHSSAATAELRRLLTERDYRLIEIGPGAERDSNRGMNLVAVAPRHVLMPAGAPAIRRHLVSAGVVVDEVEMSEYVKAGGGLGCVTGILSRGT